MDTVDPKGDPEAYPISTFTYFIFDTERLDCDALFDVLFFIFWAWTDEQAAKTATDAMLVPITKGIREACLTALAKLRCDGQIPMAGVQVAYGLGCKPGAAPSLPFAGPHLSNHAAYAPVTKCPFRLPLRPVGPCLCLHFTRILFELFRSWRTCMQRLSTGILLFKQ